ncbi:U-box domain-containing protein 52-like [Prunus yedoensis var. nudiflora]|uniref:U-box domain-containing protein 52-like n=1 Tax=Prunus yedoensis var. nudiflora TaxID=2094558 RepID=A0A314UZU4_PRUYE|nr:U-box domain-containing protein 52-like [Prunus yedoensis var. nudiflora]
MRRKDRPDLAKVVLCELNRLRALADESLNCVMHGASGVFSPRQRSNTSIQDAMSGPQSGLMIAKGAVQAHHPGNKTPFSN